MHRHGSRTTLEAISRAQYAARRFADARRTAERAVEAGRALAGSDRGNSEDKLIVPQSLILAGKASAAAGDLQPAEHSLNQATEESRRIANPHELTSLIPLAQAEGALGDFYAQQHRREDARACYQRLAQLWQSFPNPSEYVTLQKIACARRLAALN